MKNHQLINADSGDVEYYTPSNIIEAARATMGGIDLDPASSFAANNHVKAGYFLTAGMDAFKCAWFGRIWMNHPFGRTMKRPTDKSTEKYRAWVKKCSAIGLKPEETEIIHGNEKWISRLLKEFKLGQVTQACCITFAATSEKWFQPLMDYPQCFLCPRTNYHLPDGSIKRGVTKGSVVTYMGPNATEFREHFSALGKIKI